MFPPALPEAKLRPVVDPLGAGRLLLAVFAILAAPLPALGQDPWAAHRPSSVTFRNDDLQKRYVAPDHPAYELPREFINPAERLNLEKAIAYNIKYWHLVRGAAIICNNEVQDVAGIHLEAVHVYDQGMRATAYYTALTEPTESGDTGCREAKAEVVLLRLIDNELFAPEWGHRLVRPR